jgi:hypothetical protein
MKIAAVDNSLALTNKERTRLTIRLIASCFANLEQLIVNQAEQAFH